MSQIVQALQQEIETLFQADSFSHFRGLVTTDLSEKGITDVSARLARLMRREVFEAHRRKFVEARGALLIRQAAIGRVWIYDVSRLLDEHILSPENPFAEHMRESLIFMRNGSCPFENSDLVKYVALVDLPSLEASQKAHVREQVAERFWSAVRDTVLWMVLCSGEDFTSFLQLFDASDLVHRITDRRGPIDPFLDNLHQHPNTVDLVGSFCVEEYLSGSKFLRTWYRLIE